MILRRAGEPQSREASVTGLLTPPARRLFNKEWTMSVSRETYQKRKADGIAWLMRESGIKRVRVTGKRGSWKVIGTSTHSALAKFASVEAHLENGK